MGACHVATWHLGSVGVSRLLWGRRTIGAHKPKEDLVAAPTRKEAGSLSTPSITGAQYVAIAGAVIGVAVAAGLPLSKALQDSIIQLITVLAPLLLIGDATIRHGRSRALLNPPRVPLEDDTPA